MGVVEIWGPGCNLHRTPFGGRSFEYFSEDANLNYLAASHIVAAIEAKGVHAGPKHLTGNDQENNRQGVVNFFNEQAFREGALRGLEGGVVNGKAHSLMQAFNRLGFTGCSLSKALNTEVVRGEWGYIGHIETDAIGAVTTGYKTAFDAMMAAGTDSFCLDTQHQSSAAIAQQIKSTNDGHLLNQLRRAAKDILYNDANSSMMNGIGNNTKIIKITPWWQPALRYVIIAVSVLTTFTTPYMIKLAGPAYTWLMRVLPDRWIVRLDAPEQNARRSAAEQSEWKKLLQAYFLRIVLYGVVLLAIMIGSKQFLEPLASRLFPGWSPFLHNLVVVVVTLLVMAPFLYGLAISSGSINASAGKLLKEKNSNKWPIAGLVLTRSFLAISIILSVIASHFHLAGWAVVLILLGGVAFIIVARRTMHRYSALEERFLSNLNEKEEAERRRRPVTTSVRNKMAGYDVHLELLEVSPESEFAGKALRDIPFRAETGANIIKIQRGSRSINIPSGEVQVFPHDSLLAVGTTEQIGRLRTMLETSASGPGPAEAAPEFEVMNVTLREDSYLTGQTLRGTNMRDYRCMVISVLHGGEFITNPRPDYRFEAGDVVWIAGETSSCDWLLGARE